MPATQPNAPNLVNSFLSSQNEARTNRREHSANLVTDESPDFKNR